MKALGKKVERERDKIEAEIAYKAIVSQTPNLMKQSIALMLYVLNKRYGFCQKRLQDVVDDYTAYLRMPENMMGKIPSMQDAVDLMESKYKLDFSEVKPKFPTFKDWYNDKT